MSQMYEKLLVPSNRVDEIEPLDNNLLVKITFPFGKTEGGIIVTQQTIGTELRGRIIGEVLKKGPNADFCEVGDEVIFAKYSGTVVSAKDSSDDGVADGYELRIMDDKNLIAVLKKKEK